MILKEGDNLVWKCPVQCKQYKRDRALFFSIIVRDGCYGIMVTRLRASNGKEAFFHLFHIDSRLELGIADNSSQGFYLLKMQRFSIKLTSEWKNLPDVEKFIEKVTEYSNIPVEMDPESIDEFREEWSNEYANSIAGAGDGDVDTIGKDSSDAPKHSTILESKSKNLSADESSKTSTTTTRKTISSSKNSTSNLDSAESSEFLNDFTRIKISNPLLSLSHHSNDVPETERKNLLKLVKDEFVSRELKSREAEFMTSSQFTILVGTWNVNGKLVEESLVPWLKSTENQPSIVALGFQELDLSAEAFIMAESNREQEWSGLVDNYLMLAYPNSKYRKVAHKNLVGMLLLLFCLDKKYPNIRDVSTSSAGCGIMGMMGNKGGVGIRFRFYDSYLCIVNSHLAADSNMVVRRNQDFAEISKRLAFSYSRDEVSVYSLQYYNRFLERGIHDELGNEAHQVNSSIKSYSIQDADILVWMGDLNYRIPLPEHEAKAMIEKGEFKRLLVFDQLNTERKAKRVFADFDEATITFSPTYKFDPGTNNYDSSEKKRTPSWCDRVLYRKGDKLESVEYKSHPELLTSDHKPVRMIFKAHIKSIIKSKYEEIHQSIIRNLDKFENDCIPDAVLDRNIIDVGEVRYMQSKSESLTLENIGQVVAQYRFIEKLNDKHFCKPWLWINPSASLFLPGDRISIKFTVLVDNRTAAALNTGQDKLDDIVILSLTHGKDFFISVSGTFLKTCFCMPLEKLMQFKDPIRKSTTGVTALASKNPPPSLSVPKELWRILDYLYYKGIEYNGLFTTTGSPLIIEKIIECLDTGTEFQAFLPDNETTVYSMAETMVRFLDSLPEPIVPTAYFKRCIDSHGNANVAKQALMEIPSLNYNVFVYIVSFLRELLAVKKKGHSSSIPNPSGKSLMAVDGQQINHVESIGMIFSSVLLKPGEGMTYSEKQWEVVKNKRLSFLLHFLSLEPVEVAANSTSSLSK